MAQSLGTIHNLLHKKFREFSQDANIYLRALRFVQYVSHLIFNKNAFICFIQLQNMFSDTVLLLY